MDRRLLNFYNIELQHLREMAAEFAREFPKIAGRLALDRDAKDVCADPFVERLLEGFAFLAARIHLKLDAEFPRFTQALLETVYPHYLAPTPSMAVVRFEPDANAAQMEAGLTLPRGSSLKASAVEGGAACEYRTAQDVTLWPFRIAEAQYYTRDLAQLELPQNLGARAALRIRLQTLNGMPFKAIKLDRLNFFLRGADEVPVSVFEQIFTRGLGAIVRPVAALRQKPFASVPQSRIRRMGFEENEALLPFGPRSFQGYRFLHEYFTLPQRFLFFEVSGLAQGVALAEGDQIDFIIPLKEQEPRLEGRVSAELFELFCAPAINLFPMRTDRVQLEDRFSEHHVVVDKTRPLDFEVYQIESVTGYGVGPEDEQEFTPFYMATDSDLEAGAYFTANRVPRLHTAKERRQGPVSAYAGTEVYLSLVDARAAPYSSNLEQLGINALCTNRHLPVQMALGAGSTDFHLQAHAPVRSIRCVAGPTAPRGPLAEGDRSWRVISHLALNYLSLTDLRGEEGAVAFRDMLRLYADGDDAFIKKQIEGLRSAQSTPITRRAMTPGPIGFARGLEVALLFDESAFEGIGVFLLGSVLEQFFGRYVSLNSFTETVVKTLQRGELMRWPAQIGRRQLI